MEKLKKGYQIGDIEYKVHIDGFNLLPYLMGEVEHSPRRGFFYFSDDGDLVAMRFENWKIVFAGAALPGHPGNLGRTVHRRCGCRSCSTCAPIRSNTPTSPRTPTGTG